MRMLVAVVLVVCACDQGIKPKPAPAPVATKAAEVHLPDGRFTAGAWGVIAPVLTFRRTD